MTDIKKMTPEQLADHLGYLKAAKADLAKEMTETQKLLKPHLTRGRTVVGKLYQITMSNTVSMRLDVAALTKVVMPALLEQCRKPVRSIRFNINARSEVAA